MAIVKVVTEIKIIFIMLEGQSRMHARAGNGRGPGGGWRTHVSHDEHMAVRGHRRRDPIIGARRVTRSCSHQRRRRLPNAPPPPPYTYFPQQKKVGQKQMSFLLCTLGYSMISTANKCRHRKMRPTSIAAAIYSLFLVIARPQGTVWRRGRRGGDIHRRGRRQLSRC